MPVNSRSDVRVSLGTVCCTRFSIRSTEVGPNDAGRAFMVCPCADCQRRAATSPGHRTGRPGPADRPIGRFLRRAKSAGWNHDSAVVPMCAEQVVRMMER